MVTLREPNLQAWCTPGFVPVGQKSLSHSGNPPRTGKQHMDMDRSSRGNPWTQNWWHSTQRWWHSTQRWWHCTQSCHAALAPGA